LCHPPPHNRHKHRIVFFSSLSFSLTPSSSFFLVTLTLFLLLLLLLLLVAAALAVPWLIFNLEKAIELGAQGAGPEGLKVSEYTFVITFARTGVSGLLTPLFISPPSTTRLKFSRPTCNVLTQHQQQDQQHHQHTKTNLLATTQVPPMKTVRASVEVLGKHYPGRSGHILMCHGGTVASWVARVLRPMTPPAQREKLKLVTAKEDREGFMTSLVAPEQLEKRFGGGIKDCEFDPEVRGRRGRRVEGGGSERVRVRGGVWRVERYLGGGCSCSVIRSFLVSVFRELPQK
jgi:hypothetical protein